MHRFTLVAMTKYENGSTVCAQFGFINSFLKILSSYLFIYLLNLKLYFICCKFKKLSYTRPTTKNPQSLILDIYYILFSL